MCNGLLYGGFSQGRVGGYMCSFWNPIVYFLEYYAHFLDHYNVHYPVHVAIDWPTLQPA